ncbi:methyl-accepting chemotaxis protein [Marinobacter nanhaiticus D15-8W]|uniref:Methyl-accepting chemotaxis protein n=1 Tax=Marinobacter nanhaiticus D15-8W TaxID=626887 RepID=N6VY98_9GAMM|nr:methyl-accepting chemotaxis protein [Marinobacter nanhaiticus]ENO12854.1 methyl-accepting chemotaxis protein [Marinobacter nanhaiticus D15-8W]BES70204.1 methyl-accepting chemotaxis protein [Marinobacter nanhaiticus D15-8W]
MKFNLSWRQKFLALIIVTPVGLAFIGGAVFWGLESVSTSYQRIYEISRYESTAGKLVTEWSAVEKELGALSPDTRDTTANALDTLLADANALNEQAADLDDAEVANYADQIQAEAERYVEFRRQWLTQMDRLGLTVNDGIRKELTVAMKQLEELSLSLFEKNLKEISTTSRAYIGDLNPDLAEPADSAVAGLEALVEEYDWKDNVIGENTRAYRETFTRADAIVQELIATGVQAEQAGNALQDTVLAQSESLRSGLIADAIREAEGAETSAKVVSIGAIAVFGPLLVLILFLTSRVLVSRLNSVVSVLSRVSKGDLTQKLTLGKNPQDEFNILGRATNEMVDNIGKLMRESIAGTENLLEVHGELEKTMDRLSQNSEKVESQTIQAATATQQISVTLNDVAQRTSQVGVSTQSANESAQSGAQVVESSVNAMRRLSAMIQDTHNHVKQLTQAASNVTGIIDVINGLADQTNLLALNAAIEAARAGEAGRGFSVVADEVRTLAQKTVAATTNIVSIIDDLNKQTTSMDKLAAEGLNIAKEGEASATQIADAMGNVTTSIETLNSEMDQVVVAVEEISVTTEEIAQKMEEIRGQSGETQSIGQELGRQNERLSQQAGVIAESTRRFRVQ